MEQIAPGLYTFTGLTIGHVYLITEGDGLTIIDTSIPGSANKIIKQLAEAGYQPSDVKRILLTHAHFDHIGGLAELAEKTGAQVIASEIEKPYISDKQPIPRAKMSDVPLWQRPLLLGGESVNKPVTVQRTVYDGAMMPEVFGGLQVIATPGHSPGHVSYWQPEHKIIILGDVLFNFPFPGMTLPFAAFTPDMPENIRSLHKIVALEPEIVCFGHGEPLTTGAADKLRTFATRFL